MNSKWALELVDLQREDGSWGYFHTLSNPSKRYPITTEQALRRLEVLGYTIDDHPIRKAVSYMHDCLTGRDALPDRREKSHDWDVFSELMLATWIRRFTKEDCDANCVAEKWADIISHSFEEGTYDHDKYVGTYRNVFQSPPKGDRLADLATFYQVSLVADLMRDDIALALIEYLLQNPTGIYYLYDQRLMQPPQEFQSKQASRYLAAIELLAEYKNPGCCHRLAFVATWLRQNRELEGYWDMGPGAKDGVRFPLSDSWRTKELRVKDCTYRITRILRSIEGSGGAKHKGGVGRRI
jgi:hypothetical protein